jgi:hypothetical protein
MKEVMADIYLFWPRFRDHGQLSTALMMALIGRSLAPVKADSFSDLVYGSDKTL